MNLFSRTFCARKDGDNEGGEMHRNARTMLNLDKLIEMYDLKNVPSASSDRIARRESRAALAAAASTSKDVKNVTTNATNITMNNTTTATPAGTTVNNTTAMMTTTTCPRRRRRLLNTIREETSHLRDHMRERKTMNFIVKNRANKLRFGKKIYEFYNAPITKFWQNTIIYILFLISFAYIVLVKTPTRPSIPEIFVLVYVFSYGFDKIREVGLFFHLIKKTLRIKNNLICSQVTTNGYAEVFRQDKNLLLQSNELSGHVVHTEHPSCARISTHTRCLSAKSRAHHLLCQHDLLDNQIVRIFAHQQVRWCTHHHCISDGILALLFICFHFSNNRKCFIFQVGRFTQFCYHSPHHSHVFWPVAASNQVSERGVSLGKWI